MLKKSRNVETTIPLGIGFGVAACLIVTVLGAIIGATLVDKQVVAEQGIGYVALVILVFSAATGAWTAMHKLKRKKMQMCLLTGLCYYGILLAITGILFGGRYESMGITALAVLAGAGVVALLGSRGERSSTGHHKKSALVKLYKK